MAIGDVTQSKLLQKALDTTSTNSSVSNITNNITIITSITLQNTGTTKRTVSVYGYGTGASNEILKVPLEVGAIFPLTGLDYVLSNTDSFYFKQDAGTDVNIAVMGIREVIS